MTESALPDAARLRELIAGTRWHSVEVVAETGSTNADLIARADDSELAGTVRIAGFQSAGRGRHARVWKTPHGQLAMSAAVLVRPSDAERVGWLSLLTGLAVRDALSSVAGVEAELKWPNDVLAPAIDGEPGGKLSGILSEFRPLPDGGGIAVIGTGVNVDLDPASVENASAASVRGLAGRDVEGTDVAAAYLRALSDRLADWPNGVDRLVADYRASSATLGKRVRLILPGDVEVIGDAVDVDDQGRVVVNGPNGPVVASAGDVTHLRPL
ncbi:biotin--[acetyl-CoA-carboxylase] ligase [Gordonia sp. HY002]|uniref:biotin--[acetyl-CoA-carboxylase] ligase n=1 Tax=Gordonia zhenghanii TaxID=2911516 RepID=UPI001EF0097C|nr:biotin--[acetyl-CoA-carboxylase] ligase [Gordonia zhenghanii]MCF8570567.1 biotin--[acetyl-CoA-carboxylase] ligase [Gordonia zhenghanii]MCF8607432.1 biotin--[acetyl-CoA-carboxylase] ligase [Gordonia zhenghanii]